MLTLKNCSVRSFKEAVGKRKIIPFGTGSWFKTLDNEDFAFLVEQCPYAIDNSDNKRTIDFYGKTIPVYNPKRLSVESECIVLLTSPIHMYDMYMQLKAMNLPGNITCYCFPFMTIKERVDTPEALLTRVLEDNQGKTNTTIPRILHGFWFSRQKMSDNYRKCFETWGVQCPNFEIIEWNQDNYNIDTHPFLKKAIELEAWAFAADYARLEVLYRYGGFYLDMDVKLIKSLDDLLENTAILNFANSATVDLAVIGSKPHHPLIKKMLEKYDTIAIPDSREQFNAFFQPSFLRDVVRSTGVRFNGELQIMEDKTVFLPRTFFYPMDTVLFEMSAMSPYTHAIHYDNFGWSIGETDIRSKKIRDNRLLFEMIDQ